MSTPRQSPGATPPANAAPASVPVDGDAQEATPEPVESSSPPCALHEVDEEYRGF